jgi:hypothetical protein
MQYLKSQDKIILTDSTNKCLKLVDINDGHLIQSTFKPPNDSQNLFKHPFAICVDVVKNEILVSDIELSKIFIFNEKMELLRTLSDSLIKKPTAICIDNEHNIYVADYDSNLMSIWESENCNFVEKFQIQSPAYIKLAEKKLFVLNTALCGLEEKKNLLNCIFILEKCSPYGLIQTIKLDSWQRPYGLFVRNDYIFTISNEISVYCTKTDNLFLYVFNKYGCCVQKTKLNQMEAINDILIVDERIFFCYKNLVKVLKFQ